jgi:uncharacterized protein (DUF2235 family)
MADAADKTSTATSGAPKTKRIILLSDGTGNSSASVWRTNVWRVFQSLDLTDSSQVAVYDDGVGTSSFKPLAVVGGAFGYGLKRNVLDLYAFLCRNYEPGAEIFGFGFSRGAYTMRVVTGLIINQGLVPYESEDQLRRHAKAAYRAYRSDKFHTLTRIEYPLRRIRDAILRLRDKIAELRGGAKPYSKVERIHPVRIRFLGLWDTVAAYGMPIEELTTAISQWIWPLELPSRELSDRVDRACHAIAIDDERTTFHPLIWTEKGISPPPVKPNSAGKPGRWVEHETISQVWFAGMHSNVGGGYPDDSLAHIPLHWMLGEAKRCGLRLKENAPWGPTASAPLDPVYEPDAFKQARSARDKDGRLYDSRKGLGGYYRYGPRKIHDLCNIRRSWTSDYEIEVKIPKIHCSVFERVKNGAHGYAPIGLPAQYAVVTDDGQILDPPQNPYEAPEQAAKRAEIQEHVWDRVWHRRVNYFLTLFVTMVFVAFPFYIQATVGDVEPEMGTGSWAAFLAPVIQLLGSFIPKFMSGWVNTFAAYPGWFAGLAAAVILLVLRGVSLGSQINDKMRALWTVNLSSWATPKGGVPSSWEYWLRTQGWYRQLIGATKRHLVPFVLLVVLGYAGLAAANRVLFTVGNSLGLVCWGTSAPPSADAGSLFATNSLCSGTGIRLKQGTAYRIVVDTTEPWLDSKIPTTPLGFGREKMTWPMYPALPLRRHLDAPWFRLTVRIGRSGLDDHPLELVADPAAPGRYTGQLTPRSDGELFLFVNDAVIGLPGIAGLFYWNNSGKARIRVQGATP